MIDFDKSEGLIPVIIQDIRSGVVLMLGYMNREAYEKTVREKRVTFFSRSRQKLWTKGETSGNFLTVKEILTDCDEDTLLIKAEPAGPVCHTGSDTCFNEINRPDSLDFLRSLETLIQERKRELPEKSYTTRLFREGIPKISQKVGEEAVETIIEAMKDDKERFKEESADLIYHLLVLATALDVTFDDVVEILKKRHKLPKSVVNS
ncbi:MAG: Histidine biosynthesis bifunctional protein hisIE [Marinimicrobia bacterium 46_47]|nr:MAG: Histidine biosynthesis bifunctional protein hisIE [Marinimicrobia bacterium 46_47]KUK92906.1 MAG: Histidine biosynthesis bifunctional protein hisIE [Marinimicrobia bacterium 46_43]